MSTFTVKVEKIVSVENHPNAHSLDLIQILDWKCVTAKGNFKPGDLCVYFPIDSVLSAEVESKIFGPDSKVKLHHSRVKTIKLRKAISQGLAVKPETLGDLLPYPPDLGEDLTTHLKITKYEPPVKGSANTPGAASKKQVNPNFRKYTGIENAKNYPRVFEDGEQVSITEKIHGTNFRAGYVPFHANTLWKKVKKLFGFAPAYEFVYGSHNVQLQNKFFYQGFYDSNVYAEAVVKYNLPIILQPGEVIYGEIYGSSIQKGYMYGCKNGERKAVFFDVMKDDQWVDTVAFRHWVDERGLPMTPELYRGPYNKEKVLELRDGDSVLAPSQKVREGVVVKPLKEENCYMGRKMLKYISDNYLLKNQDEEGPAH